MDICQEINKAKKCAGEMAYRYSVDATFGEATEYCFYSLLRINAYIRALERNIPENIEIKEKISLEGQKINISSLKKENNTLILDHQEQYTCSIIEKRRCLSDEEICVIVENINILCSNANCNCN